MQKLTITCLFLLLGIVFFSCEREYNNPYDRDCAPEMWTPENLIADTSANEVLLTWEQTVRHFDGFLIDRSSDSTNWKKISSKAIDKETREYTDTTAFAGDTLYYRIYAIADKNASNYCYSNRVLIPVSLSSVTTIDEEAIPIYLQEDLKVYMPIYEGAKPPIVEGIYLISKMVAVYCADGIFAPGDLALDLKIKFTEQDRKTNILCYDAITVGPDSYASSDSVSIIGNGNNFTAYFINEVLSTNGLKYKTATIISGTIGSTGIKNLYYAFIQPKIGYNPDNDLMDEYNYRIFKDGDGLAENTTWNKSIKINP